MDCLFILQRVDDILQFIKDYTMDVEGVGHVCRLAYNVMTYDLHSF